MGHAYLGLTDEEVRAMLRELGLESVDELYRDVPQRIMLDRELGIPGPLSEEEVRKHVKTLFSKNEVLKLFIGGGVWPHSIPAAVKEIVGRSEFLTSYTPYQPEISQGVLQALFEYQSLMAELLEIDIVNASMYDWATALAEALRMAARVTKRRKILYPRYIAPQRLQVSQTYLTPLNLEMEEYSVKLDGSADLGELEKKLGEDVAAVYLEMPAYLGYITPNVREVGELAHDHGALFVIGVDPTALGILEAPGKLGADIVVGEGQPLGLPLSFGGPLLGILGCSMDRKLVHQLPGRLIGMTKTRDGERAYTMILQAREQHIKREKATSNICTNQALCAIAAAVHLSLLGKTGIRKLGEHIIARTQYFIDKISAINGVEAPLFKAPHFKEFVFRVKGMTAEEVLLRLLEKGIVGGIDVGREFMDLSGGILTCVTEIHSKDDINEYVRIVKEVVEG